MDAYVVTESSFDSEILQRILPDAIRKDVEFVPSGGLSSVKSMARSLLVLKRKPVAIVVDADSIDEDSIEERRQSIEEVVGSIATAPFRAFLAIPDLENVFFRAPSLLRRYFGRHMAPDSIERFLELGGVSGKHALQLLGAGFNHSFALLDAATPPELETLREASPILELAEFLNEAHVGSLRILNSGA